MPFHSGYGYYGTGDWLWSIFSTALFIVLVTLAIMLLVRAFSGARRQGPGTSARPVGAPWWGPGGGGGPVGTRPAWGTGAGPDAATAERILAERYARGEISEEEYRGRLDVLRQSAAGWARPAAEPQSPPQLPQQQSAQPQLQPPASAPTAAGQDLRTEEVK